MLDRPTFRHGNLPAAMRQAARDALSEGFYPGLREVSRRCGVSATAAYRHFDGRDGLLSEVAIEAFAEVTRLVGAASSPADGALAYVDWASANPALFVEMFEVCRRSISTRLAEAARDVLQVDPRAHGVAMLVVSGLMPPAAARELLSSEARQ